MGLAVESTDERRNEEAMNEEQTNQLTDGFNPSRPNPGRREKIKLNFYFHTSLWCLKWSYEDL